MGDNRNVLVGDANKLIGLENYYVWSLKMRAILGRENWWPTVESRIEPEAFLVIIGRRQLNAN